MIYDGLYEFNDAGMDLFRKVMLGELPEETLDPLSTHLVDRIDGTKSFEVIAFKKAKDVAECIIAAANNCPIPELIQKKGLWGWLSFVFRDVAFPRTADGRRTLGEVHRWYPGNPSDYQKAQRHLIRMPVTLLFQLGGTADHLLCGAPSKLPEIREQLTSQQDMIHPGFQMVARSLYYDPASASLRKGAGSKGAGTPRRLAKVKLQLDVTWDLYALQPSQILELLPKEFERWRGVGPSSARNQGSSVKSEGVVSKSISRLAKKLVSFSKSSDSSVG
jgi:hypothetical protein